MQGPAPTAGPEVRQAISLRAIAGDGTTKRRHRRVRLLNRIAATDIAVSQAGIESMVRCRGEFAGW